MNQREEKAIEKCYASIARGNCPGCDVCPVFAEFAVPENERERAIKEHRFGVGADDFELIFLDEEKATENRRLG